jgi:phosphatidate cytidylyltransferase
MISSVVLLIITGLPMAVWTFVTNSDASRLYAGRWFTWMMILCSGLLLVMLEPESGAGYPGYLIFWALVWAVGMFETVRLGSSRSAASRIVLGLEQRALVAAIWMLAISVACWQLVSLGSKAFVLFFVVALFDIGGWVGGKTFGRIAPFSHRIFPITSPNKTLGGLVVSITLGAAAWWWVFTGYGLLGAAGNADPLGFLVLAAFAIFGDWFESKLKRLAGVKDAGTLIPGFGGVLDRFDSIFWVAIGTLAYLAF